jgi:Glycosyltransferase family 87
MTPSEMSPPEMTPSEHRKKLWRFAYVSALSIWMLMAFEIFFEWFKKGEMFALYMDKHPYLIDFPLYYAAGLIANTAMHTPTNIYDIHLQDRVLRSVIAPVVPELPWFIQYPPPLFLAASVLPLMSLPVAWGVWCLVGDAFIFLSIYLLLKDDCPTRKDFAYIALAVGACYPFWVCNRLGQLALFTIPSAIMFWWLLRNKRPIGAGITSALLVLKFQYLPFLGVVGLVQGRIRYFLSALVSCVVVMATSGLLLGWPNVINYPQTVMHAEYATDLYSGVRPQDQQNIRSLLVRLTGSDSPIINKVCIALCLIVAAVLFVLWLKSLKSIEPNKRFKFLASLTIVCMLAFSPHAHTQDYLIMSVPAAWIWLESLRSGGPPSRWARYFVISLPMVSWVLFTIDKLLPVPPFLLVAPFVVAAAWASFCSPAAQAAVSVNSGVAAEPTS